MRTTVVISQVHIRIRQGAGEPLEHLCDFSGDALLNLRSMWFAKTMDEVVLCFQISECSLPSGWHGEMNRQWYGIFWRISISVVFFGRGKIRTEILKNVFCRLNCWFKLLVVACLSDVHAHAFVTERCASIHVMKWSCVAASDILLALGHETSLPNYMKMFLRPLPDQVRRGAQLWVMGSPYFSDHLKANLSVLRVTNSKNFDGCP